MQLSKRPIFCATLLFAVRDPTPAQVGKDGEVLTQRDRWGVPHIYGNSSWAVAFGSGDAQPEDHLDRMLRLFLKARGGLGKVEGQSALTQHFYQAFADAINRYSDTHPKEELPWYWKVEARDVAVYMRFTIPRNGWAPWR